MRVEYGVAGAPSIPSDWFGPWEHYWYPASGLLQTSSELYQGAASAENYYYSGDELTPLPPNMEHGGAISWCFRRPDGTRPDREFITFFIGPKEVYEKHKHELQRLSGGDCQYVIKSLDDLPKVGNISDRLKGNPDHASNNSFNRSGISLLFIGGSERPQAGVCFNAPGQPLKYTSELSITLSSLTI